MRRPPCSLEEDSGGGIAGRQGMCWDESPKKVDKTAVVGKSIWPGKTRGDAHECAWIVTTTNDFGRKQRGLYPMLGPARA